MSRLCSLKKDNWKWTRRTFKLVGGSFAAGLPLAIYAIVGHYTPAPELTEMLDVLVHNAKAIGTIIGVTLAIPAGHASVGITKWGYARYKQHKLRTNNNPTDNPSSTAASTHS